MSATGKLTYRFSKTCSLPHIAISLKTGERLLPNSVSEYSTRGGISLYSFRVMSPSFYTEKEILDLHGMGKASMPILRKALEEEGLTFKDESETTKR